MTTARRWRSARESAAVVLLAPGLSETRTVSGIRTHEPNRFGEDAEGEGLTSWIHRAGQRVPVQMASSGDVMVWEVVDERARWQACAAKRRASER